MRLRVGETEDASPRPTDDQPSLDAKRQAQAFDVAHEVVRPVRAQVGGRIGGMGARAAAVALVEENDAIRRRIEQAAKPGRAPGSRPAVKDDRRLACRIAACLPVKGVAVADIE